MNALEDAYRQANLQNIKVKGILITNPSNPLGTTIDAWTLSDLLSFGTQKNIHLICDEIYGGSVFSSPRFVSIAEIVAADKIKTDRVHIIYTLSKDVGLPGFRVGVIYSYNDAVVTTARRMSSFTLVSSQTQHFLGAMLNDREFVREYVKENQKRLRERHSVFERGLREAGLRCLKSNAGLFCWVDMRHLLEEPGVEGELRLWKIILHQIGLNVSPGSSCHCKEAGWFRFCFANLDLHTLQLAIDHIRSFTKENRRLSSAAVNEGISSLMLRRGLNKICGPNPQTPSILRLDEYQNLFPPVTDMVCECGTSPRCYSNIIYPAPSILSQKKFYLSRSLNSLTNSLSFIIAHNKSETETETAHPPGQKAETAHPPRSDDIR